MNDFLGVFVFLIVLIFLGLVIYYVFLVKAFMFFRYKSLAQELKYDYIGSWKSLKLRGDPFPEFLSSDIFNRVSHIVKGSRDGRTFYYLNKTYGRGNSLTLFVFQNQKAEIPPFYISPLKLFGSRPFNWAFDGHTLKNINSQYATPFENTSHFLKKYQIVNFGKEENEAKIVSLMNTGVLSSLMQTPHWFIQGSGDWLLVYLDPELIFPVFSLDKLLDRAFNIATLFGF